MLSYFDSHCHIDHPCFDEGRATLWQACQMQGISHLLIPGLHPKQWQVCENLAHTYPGMLTAQGLHPWWLAKASLPTFDHWCCQLQHSSCVAIGECGLDALISEPMAKQEAVFSLHLKVAKEMALPLIIHARKTHHLILPLLKRYQLSQGGVVHGFTGSLAQAKAYWQLGFLIGVGGSITYLRAKKTRHSMANLPLDALVLETDSPDMPLYGYQGQNNSPLQLPKVARALAALRQLPLEVVVKATTANSQRLFGAS